MRAFAAHGRAGSYGLVYIRPGIYTAGILILAREGFPAPSVSGTDRGPRLRSAVCIIDSVGARLSFVSRPRPRLDNICARTRANKHAPRRGIAKTFARSAASPLRMLISRADIDQSDTAVSIGTCLDCQRELNLTTRAGR